MISFSCRAGVLTSMCLVLALSTISRQSAWAQAPSVDLPNEELLPPPLPQPPRAAPAVAGIQSAESNTQDSPMAVPAQLGAPAAPAADWEEISPMGLWQAGTEDSSAEGYDVLLQGPVHEAFAILTDVDPRVGVRLYTEPPPEPIDEQPPALADARPGLQWIPGYWAWSDEVEKHVWVSGIYRQVPPGRSWIPGFWSASGSGYRWTNGYWTSQQLASDETQYVPLPPSSIDNGPSVPPPGDDYFWLPGHWEYVGDRYRWQSGYWTAYQEGWVWQPACYVYSPQGFVFIDGYWDLLPTQRGQLYAPVVFNNNVYQQANYIYQPRYSLVDPAAFLLHLFTRPGYSQYFYGNYYGSNYTSRGYRPWYASPVGSGLNSQWIEYYNWNYGRSGIDFVGSMQRYNDLFHSNPGQTPKYLKQALKNADVSMFGNPSSGKGHTFARSLDQLIQREVGGKPAKTLDPRSAGSAWQASSPGQNKGRPAAGFAFDMEKGKFDKQKEKFDKDKGSNSNRGSAWPSPQPLPSMKQFGQGSAPSNRGGGDSKSKGGNGNSKSSSGKGKGK